MKDGKTYRIPNKRIQSQQAFRSRLSYQGKEMRRILRMPQGSLFGSEVPMEDPVFREHCQTCGSRMTCNGCSNCGACETNGETSPVARYARHSA